MWIWFAFLILQFFKVMFSSWIMVYPACDWDSLHPWHWISDARWQIINRIMYYAHSNCLCVNYSHLLGQKVLHSPCYVLDNWGKYFMSCPILWWLQRPKREQRLYKCDCVVLEYGSHSEFLLISRTSEIIQKKISFFFRIFNCSRNKKDASTQ